MTKKILFLLMVMLVGTTLIYPVFASNYRLPENPGYNSSNLISSDLATKSNNIVATFVFIVNVIAVVTMVFMGLRYMFASADAKADIKSGCIAWTVGAVIVFGATSIIGIVLETVTGDEYITITPDSTATTTESTPDDWAKSYWNAAKSVGLLPASIENKPKATITRAEFVQSVYLLAQKIGGVSNNKTNNVQITDVTDVTLKSQIIELYRKEIITGISEDANGNITFSPNSHIKREDVATILYRLLVKSYKYDRTIADSCLDTSANIYAEVSGYAKEAMCYMNKVGIIIGDTSGNLLPKKNITGQEAIKIIYETYLKIK